MTAPLDALLRSDPAEMDARAAGLLARESGGAPCRFVLCGAGHLGRLLLRGLRRAGIEPLAFADNSAARLPATVDGVPVLHTPDAAGRFRDEAIFVASVFNASRLRRQLTDLGVRHVSARALCFAYPHTLIPLHSIGWPSAIIGARDDVLEMYERWGDEKSRAEYESLLRWHLLDVPETTPPSPVEETYFAPDLVSVRSGGTWVDCGAFDGDTFQAIVARAGHEIDRLVGVEPDPTNFGRLQEAVAALPSVVRDRTRVVQCAVGATPGVVRFSAMATAGSSLSAAGEIEVECRTLDDLLHDEVPSFIKVDIEGAEPLAIEGARGVLRRARPTLALCLYHEQRHLWEVPLQVHAVEDSYRLHLRRYAEDCWETVCYAIAE